MTGENLNPDPDSEGEGKSTDENEGLKAALTAERRKRQTAETEAAEFRGQVEGLQQVNRSVASAPKDLSAADLRVAVDEGRMTEDEAGSIRDSQSERRITATVTESLSGKIDGQRTADKVGGEIARYKTIVPEITDHGSVQFAKVKNEFEYLTTHGYDAKDPRTELMAARAAFGPLDALETAGEAKPRETFSETGGGAEPDGGGSGDNWPKNMTADQRTYYDDQINQGVFTDKKAALEEFNYKPKHKPRRAA